jgi:hypothetical protein
VAGACNDVSQGDELIDEAESLQVRTRITYERPKRTRMRINVFKSTAIQCKAICLQQAVALEWRTIVETILMPIVRRGLKVTADAVRALSENASFVSWRQHAVR